MEQWWDDVELRLAAVPNPESKFPMLSQVDPYGFTTIHTQDLPSLQAELEQAIRESTPGVVEIIERLRDLCLAAMERSSAELRFVGD